MRKGQAVRSARLVNFRRVCMGMAMRLDKRNSPYAPSPARTCAVRPTMDGPLTTRTSPLINYHAHSVVSVPVKLSLRAQGVGRPVGLAGSVLFVVCFGTSPVIRINDVTRSNQSGRHPPAALRLPLGWRSPTRLGGSLETLFGICERITAGAFGLDSSMALRAFKVPRASNWVGWCSDRRT